MSFTLARGAAADGAGDAGHLSWQPAPGAAVAHNGCVAPRGGGETGWAAALRSFVPPEQGS
jgi:hypothetical protein